MGEPFRLLWTASRDWVKPREMWTVLGGFHSYASGKGRILVIVHGDAPGGDMIGKLFGQITEGAEEEAHPADWEGPCRETCEPGHRRKDKHGRYYCPAAGMYRNEEMVALGAARCAAWIRARSPGASRCALLAQRSGIETRRFTDG